MPSESEKSNHNTTVRDVRPRQQVCNLLAELQLPDLPGNPRMIMTSPILLSHQLNRDRSPLLGDERSSVVV